jgi:hypothetical protein
MKSVFTFALLAIALTAGVATPALASKNDGRFAKTQSMKVQSKASACSLAQDLLIAAENAADSVSGTPAAEQYAKEADKQWAKGEALGCSWAH